MTTEDFFTPFLAPFIAFVFGLVAKFIYDIWYEKRQRKSLLYVKTILSSFTIDSLEESIREQISVAYAHKDINSIHLVKIEVENNGSSVIKNQAFTVRFSKDAEILSDPISTSSSEDLRHIDIESPEFDNSRRFSIHLLRKGATVSWIITVINHDKHEFIVEPGVLISDYSDENVDLDVSSKITSERAEIDLTDRVKKILIALISLLTLVFIHNTSSRLLYSGLSTIISSVFIISLFAYLLMELVNTVGPFFEWLSRNQKSDSQVQGDMIHGDKISGHKYNITSTDPITVNDIEEMINKERTDEEE